jgi:hypothetical protein
LGDAAFAHFVNLPREPFRKGAHVVG